MPDKNLHDTFTDQGYLPTHSYSKNHINLYIHVWEMCGCQSVATYQAETSTYPPIYTAAGLNLSLLLLRNSMLANMCPSLSTLYYDFRGYQRKIYENNEQLKQCKAWELQPGGWRRKPISNCKHNKSIIIAIATNDWSSNSGLRKQKLHYIMYIMYLLPWRRITVSSESRQRL